MNGAIQTVRWPAKIRKFGIEDPEPRYLAREYESAIPWQPTVRKEADRRRHFRREMVPALMDRLFCSGDSFPDRRYLLRPSQLHLERVIEGEAHLTTDERNEAREVRVAEGEEAARRYVAGVLNRKKEASFQEWVRKVENQWFRSEHAFVYRVLRGMIDGLGKGTFRLLHPPDRQILH